MASIAAPISSTSDMMASVPNDLFDGISATPDVDVDDTPVDETPASESDDNTIDAAEPESGDAPAIDEPPAEEAAPDATEEKDKPVKAEESEELPEGVVKGKDRKGKAGYFLEENRYQTFHGNHKLVQEGAQILGEPFTADAIRLRNDAYLAQERLFTHLTSGDPGLQTQVMTEVIKEMAQALKNGEVGIDPSVPFAESVYNTLQAQAPAAYEHLQLQAARDLTNRMYAQASQTKDVALFSSAQRIVAALSDAAPKPADMPDEEYAQYLHDAAEAKGLTFHTVKEMERLLPSQPAPDPRDKRITDLEAQLRGRSAGPAEQYATWAKKNVSDVNSAILDGAVKPSLAAVEGGWKQFPDDYKRLVVDPLHREVIAAVKADPGFDQLVRDLQDRAHRATSEQVRSQLGTQITQLFLNRAKMAADAKKGPIVKFAADWLKGRSDQTHERRTSAQTHTTPKGPGAPVKPSLIPPDTGFKDGIYDPSTAMKQMQALLR